MYTQTLWYRDNQSPWLVSIEQIFKIIKGGN